MSFGRASAATLVTLALAAAGAPAPAAAAPAKRTICVDKVAVYESPGGFAIAYLYRPQTLRVLGTARRRSWSLVRFDDGPRGWIPTNRICT